MKASRSIRGFVRSGYTLVEVLVASGLVAAAIGAAAKLSMTMSKQEEMARGQAAAIRYAEAVSRLWQLGANPADVLLSQTNGVYNPDPLTADSVNIMSAAITPVAGGASLGTDGGIAQGNVEQATVTVTYRPYGSSANASLTLDVIRPAAFHR
jgi:type II secretory pathway pseudopilin PulG